ncbi:hypothetical protein HER14_16185 [Acidithiobacillus thiooxidans]|uniref:hypothetical protein n=1 Tax=Acidithiobacillus thiooxidans TaxID=930 RepID=UPI001C067B72|nr:hypothetical protein [Acidithiobacillus thiooxidans]MBU2752424.1 hypothetical protein [Acidithiobacillus thiooxidans]MBU2835386.1 hypothetical protein [Acidithiobacillus thiooxidans]
MEIYDRQFPPYQHHCLTGRRLAHGDLDPYCKTPYQRGWFLGAMLESGVRARYNWLE